MASTQRGALRPAPAVVGLLSVALLWLVLPLWTAPAAAAHVRLLRSDPRPGAVLDLPPRSIVLQFSRPIAPAFAGATLRLGDTVLPSKISVNGSRVVVAADPPWSPSSPAGSWRLRFRVVSQDGHPVEGRVAFTVTDVAESPATRDESESAPRESAAPSDRGSTGPRAAEPAQGSSLVPIAAAGALVIIVLAGLVARVGRRNTT